MRDGVLSGRLALLLGATALSVMHLSPAAAQFVDLNGDNGSGGTYFFFSTDGDDGDPGGSNGVGSTNTTNYPNPPGSPPPAGTAWGGSANGGRGGNGVTFFSLNPFDLGFEAGAGGRGGRGGTITLTNDAYLETSGSALPPVAGFLVQANGGNGGNGGPFETNIAGDGGGTGGDGGDGGTATGITTVNSVIHTAGNNVNGMTVRADGGNGGNGGFTGTIGFGSGADGGRGGSGGTAVGNNAGEISTSGHFSKGMLVRSAGGSGGDGAGTIGIVDVSGGNGGAPTTGGAATGTNSGRITTQGDFASGMVFQSVGGGGGDGGGAFGFFAGGGAGAGGNHGGTATGTNTGTIVTRGVGAIGMLVESVGGGGGDGGGAVGSVALGGSGGGGGEGRTAYGYIGGFVTTGELGGGHGAHGILIQSVGGGGGNGGFAVGVNPLTPAVGVGGAGGTASKGGEVYVYQADGGPTPTVRTNGTSAIGILAQSVGGGGGNGGGAYTLSGTVAVGVGGRGGAGGAGDKVVYDVGYSDVLTQGENSAGILVQSVGGGGGNGGFTLDIGGIASVGVGGSAGNGGDGGVVEMTTGGKVETMQDRSVGIIAQSIGGGGGNGGGALTGGGIVTVGIGRSGAGAGDGKNVTFDGTQSSVTTHGSDSTGILVQSVGGGGGNGGFAIGVGGAVSVGVGGSGGAAGNAGVVEAKSNGSVTTSSDRSIGILVQSVGGGGGNGGAVITGSGGASIGVGGSGGGGGDSVGATEDTVMASFHTDNSVISTGGADSAGIVVQSIGGGGGNGSFVGGFSLAASVGIGGSGGTAGNAGAVRLTDNGGSVTTQRERSSALIAQSIGGGGGNGGGVVEIGLGLNIGIGGKGAGGGTSGTVDVVNAATLKTGGYFSHGILAQSIGGGGGSGGFSVAVGGPSFSLGGTGAAAGGGKKVTVSNSGGIETGGDLSNGIFAQSVGGSGGDGGFSVAAGAFAAVGVGGAGGGGGLAGEVEVTNNANITTKGALSHGILAQSVGGGGGNGGSTGSLAVGVFGAAAIAVGGGGGEGNFSSKVTVTHKGDIHVGGTGSKAILAQSVGGSGGNGGNAYSGAFSAGLYVSGALGVSVGGEGGDGGNGGQVTVRADGQLIADTDAVGSGGIVAQSIGGGGGNGGRAASISGAVSNGASIALGVTVGGWAGDGGKSDLVVVDSGLDGGGMIVTRGDNSVGLLAQSIGGSGGNGGDSWSAAGGYGVNASINATVSIGGGAGNGNISGDVLVNNAMTIQTAGDMSSAIIAQSIGGGGGNGGATNGATADLGTQNGVNVAVNVGVGGGGGTGNISGVVDLTNSGDLTTTGDYSSGIVAQSIGGGGGMGGSANAKAFHVGGTSGTSVTANVGIGGNGGSGNDAACAPDEDGNPTCAAGRFGVHVDNSGAIRTSGFNSIGILAMSVGGGGGAGGAASTDEEIVGGGDEGETSVGIGAALALAAGGAGNGGTVSVTNSSRIVTNGADSYGISANSIGGGGGVGGSASSGTIGKYAIGGSLGGAGGEGGNGAQVDVFNLSTAGIWTQQERSIGIFAQSVGGGGGAGGAGSSKGKSDGAEVSVNLSLGGAGEVGGDGGKVNVENSGWIQTDKANSHGILAQSIGGSGGVGGASGTSANDSTVAITLSLGGAGGDGGISEKVTVRNFASGEILTKGDNSHGIFAQSVGGGGGAGGAGSTENGEAETAVTLFIGGQGGLGSRGGAVQVDNHGRIETLGYISHGIFAQSVGGGGGASGAASGASKADMTIGGGASGIPLPPSDDPDEKSNGGYVEVNNYGEIETHKDGSYGIFAQSVGGGGGYGGTVSSDLPGTSSANIGLGGFGGNGGDGGDVRVTVSGSIITHGDRAHGVVAQSIGGGGGVGGDAKGNTSNSLSIGGFGGKGGNGGDVTVIRTGTITTTGKDAMAIFAQSVGGGGGLGGAGFGRFGATEDGGSGIDNNTVGFTSFSGAKGDGGIVTIEQDGDIATTGDRAHGIVAQAVGGGGGAGGTLTDGAAGSGGGIGDAQAASAITKSQVWVTGGSTYAMFGQSSTGDGTANNVHLGADGSLLAQGLNSVAAYGESTSDYADRRGDITIDLKGRYAIGGSGAGVAVALVGGINNVVTNHSLTYAMASSFTYIPGFEVPEPTPGQPFVPENARLDSLFGYFSDWSITGTSGNDQINNQRTAGTLGRVIGNIDLGGGDSNGFHNFADSSMVGLATIDLGGGTFLNDGMMTNKGIGFLGSLFVGGGFTQSLGGLLVTDLDLENHDTDFTDLSGAGDFNGEAPLNFTSINRLFDRDGYVIATGATMQEDLLPTLLHPAVGFNFQTRVEGGTDLVLYTDNPTFEDLINDPQSGVSDPGVVQMAQYLDGLENVQLLYDQPTELARMLNMIRFLPNEEEFGKAMTRLTPHYAVHTFDMINRSADAMLGSARECTTLPDVYDYDGRCIWFTISPELKYNRDAGPGTTNRNDIYKTISLGGIGEINDRWSLGAMIGRTEFDSEIEFKDELLSKNGGESWQAYALAKYVNQQYFADFALGGGTGKFEGQRDTTLAQVGFIPGETLAGEYLDEILHPGIGNSVSFKQDTAQFGGSARFGMTRQFGDFYLQPSIQFDARYLKVSGEEAGSVAAFSFDGSSNTYLSATPGLEIGTHIPLSEKASLRLYAKGGIELSNMDWKIKGQFVAAEGLGAPPLVLTEEVDSPLYRVGAGVELNGVNGVGLAVRYNGAFGDKVKLNSVSAALKVRF